MPPPPNRRWPRRRGGGGNRPPRSTADNSADPSSGTPAKRPKLNDVPVPNATEPVDVERFYNALSDGQELKPYSDLSGTLDKALLDGVDKMGFKYMTPVQHKVLTNLPTLSSDCVVQAKTGTGKTAAFLLPAIQNLLSGNMPPRNKVGILVICPTRELALQIAKECHGIVACLPRPLQCYTAFGGTARASSLKAFLTGDPTILVATPGRLDDILGEEEVRERFTHLKTLVLDEADRMLDAGFAPAIHKILKSIPPKSDGWQGMCFSATLPDKVNNLVKGILFPGYTTLSTVDANEVPTVDRVPQFVVTVPTITQTLPALLALIEVEYNQHPQDFKAIVFGTTANGVGLLHDLYKYALPQFRLYELHSRMSQNARTRTTNDFKDATSGILFASDVVGRGMDFPNVGHVFQVGLPSNTEQYIHRVGRTARAGKDGRAIMLLFENESFFPRTNPILPIQPYPVDIAAELPKHQPAIDKAFVQVDEVTKAKAYQAFLGYNKMYLKKLRLDPRGLVNLANEYATAMGCPEPPLIEKSVVSKMGLKGVGGLRIGSTRK